MTTMHYSVDAPPAIGSVVESFSGPGVVVSAVDPASATVYVVWLRGDHFPVTGVATSERLRDLEPAEL